MATADVKLIQVLWNAEAAELLADAAGDHPTYTVDDLRREIETQKTALYCVLIGPPGQEKKIGYFAAWVDDFGTARELVLQAGGAFLKFSDGVRMAMPAIRQLAHSLGCKHIRSHVSKAAKLSGLKSAGFRKSETVVRLDL